jgi:nucleotide-binding universal stress UspA family protein
LLPPASLSIEGTYLKGGEVMGGTIMCAVGDSSEARSAVELATALRARLGLRLVLVAVVDGVPPAAEESVTARQRQTGAELTLRELARETGDDTETRVVLGHQVEALAQVAAEEAADVIVVGSRPAGLGNRMLRSPLARDLEAATPVPVLVAPPSTRKRSEQRLATPAGAAR